LPRVAEIPLAVHIEPDAVGPAVAADAAAIEPDAPLDEELSEPVRDRLVGLGVKEAEIRMGVERRDADSRALDDAAVADRPVWKRSVLDGLVERVDADPRRDRHPLAVDEDVEVRVDVIGEV